MSDTIATETVPVQEGPPQEIVDAYNGLLEAFGGFLQAFMRASELGIDGKAVIAGNLRSQMSDEDWQRLPTMVRMALG